MKVLIFLMAALLLYGCTQPAEPSPTPPVTPTTTPNPTGGVQACGPEQCHGLDITCGPNVAQVCTMEFRVPDDVCLQYVRCQVVNGVCQHTNPQFQQCKQCVEQCKAEGQNGQVCMERCTQATPRPAKTTDAPANDCQLYQNKNTGNVECFGCSGRICRDPGPDMEPYTPTGIGIPYACYPTENGCQLVQ